MDRAAFERLYLHANCIAELGFARSMLRIMAEPPPEPTPEEIEAFNAGFKQFEEITPENWDPSLLDRQPDDPVPPPAAAGPGVGELVPMHELPDGMPDVARYYADAQAVLPQLQPRIDDCFGRADHAAIEAALARAPAQPAPITGPLTDAQFEAWLVLYEARKDADESPLAEAVMLIRSLEPMF